MDECLRGGDGQEWWRTLVFIVGGDTQFGCIVVYERYLRKRLRCRKYGERAKTSVSCNVPRIARTKTP